MSDQPRNKYARRDLSNLEPHFTAHMIAMTAEGLESKADIAAELAWRDTRIRQLQAELDEAAFRTERREIF